MAVTITADELAVLLPSTVEEENRERFAQRILNFAPTAVERLAPDAPEAMQNEATIRLAGYLADRDSLSVSMISEERAIAGAAQSQFASAWRFSGAQSLLLPWMLARPWGRGGRILRIPFWNRTEKAGRILAIPMHWYRRYCPRPPAASRPTSTQPPP